MAEAERRPGKTPLLKQPEIEEVDDEEKSHTENNESSDEPDDNKVYDREVIDTSTDCLEGCQTVEHAGASVSSLVTNGVAAVDVVDLLPSTVTQAEGTSSPESLTNGRSLKMNHSLSSKSKPLMRSSAICEDSMPEVRVLPEVKVITTPAPDSDESPCEYNSPLSLLGQDVVRAKLQKNGSLSSDAGTSNCSLSRESSIEKNMYKDSSGCDLEEFIKKTLVKSKKDKLMLLNLERDFKIFVNSEDQHYQLAEMCSYDRMICHRVAAFYGMEHNIDKSGKCVIVSKTKFTRIPTFSCEEHMKTVESSDESGSERKMRLLKKPASMEERSQGRDKEKFHNQRTKSLEERQKTYDEKRAEIFGSKDDPNYSVIEPLPGGGCKHLSSREWSSTDSSGYMSEDGSRLRRTMMPKANSYGDSITCYDSAPIHTKLTSPENSQSPISRSSSADVNSPSQGFVGGSAGPPYTVLVAPDIHTIPPGSLVVNPHTLQPHINADGTPYRYDPNDPPPWLVQSSTPSHQPPPHVHHHHHQQHQQPIATSISYTPNSSIHQVQYTTSNDLCNRLSVMEIGPAMEPSMDGQQLMTFTHHQQQAPHQLVHQPHPQPANQLPLMVSTNMQPAQQFVTYTGTAQTPGFYPQFQFVQMDAQGQCVPMTTPSGNQLFTYGPQMMPGLSSIQPMDQSGMGSFTQTMYQGPVSDSTGANGYCMPAYVPGGSVVYTGPHYPSNAGNSMMTPISAAHYGSYNRPQSSSPQLCQAYQPMGGAQVRPATPPGIPIGQPVGYPGQQGGMVSSTQQYQQQFYSTAQHHQFPGPQPQVMQVAVRPQGGAGSGVSVHPHHHQHHPHQNLASHQHHQPSQHLAGNGGPPQLQHCQSFPVMRTIPTAPLAPSGLGPSPTAATPAGQQTHAIVSMQSMSMGSLRLNSAATPDKDPASSLAGGGGASMLGGFGQAGTAMQFSGQFVTQSMRQPQPGEFRVMGAASIRPQMTPPLIAFQPGQPVRNSRPYGPRQSRPPRRNNSNASHPTATTATAPVSRVMSLDSASIVHQVINRP